MQVTMQVAYPSCITTYDAQLTVVNHFTTTMCDMKSFREMIQR